MLSTSRLQAANLATPDSSQRPAISELGPMRVRSLGHARPPTRFRFLAFETARDNYRRLRAGAIAGCFV